MQRFVMIFVLFSLFLLPAFPISAQEVETVVVEEIAPASPETQHFGPPPSTFVKLIQISTQADMRGKRLFIHTMNRVPNTEDSSSFIGITKAQQLHIQAKVEEIEKRFEKIEPLFSNDWNQLSPEEVETRENKFMEVFSQALDDMDTSVRETLTPIQLQKAREYQLVNPGFMGEPVENTINFDAYDALELSEEQKKQLKKIREETETEYKKIFENLKSDPEVAKSLQKLSQTLNSEKMKTFTEKMKEKVHKILTPEQRERITQIKKEVPEKIAEIKRKKASEPKEDDSWKDFWKPGDPLPEGAVPPRRAPRFPMGR